jgi:lycopene beta-cyclase
MSRRGSGSDAPPRSFEMVLVGGGLQNGLISLACLARDPARSIAVVEASEVLGGNHTWSLHAEDVPDAALPFIDDLIVARYDSYDVQFPTFTRTVEHSYSVISSARFAEVVEQRLRRAPACELLLNTVVASVETNGVQFRDGRVLRADVVIDARGPGGARPGQQAGYQKFLGRELLMRRPHGLVRPVLMDATVPQNDGFRFFYVLPLGPDRLLVEDTAFSRSPVLDLESARASIGTYAARWGEVAECLREESGVLPMPWANGHPIDRGSPLRAGYAGGFFHPATGYSLPVALRLAMHVASHTSDDMFERDFEDLVFRHTRQARYAQELNRLLFHCFAPEEMWNVFARFYRLPEPVIARFYALTLTRWDQARILLGRPPRGFSIAHALTASRLS